MAVLPTHKSPHQATRSLPLTVQRGYSTRAVANPCIATDIQNLLTLNKSYHSYQESWLFTLLPLSLSLFLNPTATPPPVLLPMPAAATVRGAANWKSSSKQTIRCFFPPKDTAGPNTTPASRMGWDIWIPDLACQLNYLEWGEDRQWGLPTEKQGKPPKFVKELRPNPTMSLLKEGGRSQPAFKGNSYLQLSTHLHLGEL